MKNSSTCSPVLAVVLALVAALACASCSATAELVGLESVAAANERQAEDAKFARETAAAEAKAKQAETEAAVVSLLAPLEPFVPGIQQAARDVFAGKPTVVVQGPKAPEPRPDRSIDIGEVGERYGIPALAVLGYVLDSMRRSKKTKEETKAEVNRERDQRREEIGLPRTREEAIRLGWITPDGRPIPEPSASGEYSSRAGREAAAATTARG